jgi:hypothetical protein
LNASNYPTAYAHWIEVIGTITTSSSDLIEVLANLELTISSDGSGVLEASTGSNRVLYLQYASTVTLRDITLKQVGGYGFTVTIDDPNAKLILERGSRITRTASGSVVNVNDGTLEMYADSEIYGGNYSSSGGGVQVQTNGTLNMYGGSSIHDNHSSGTGGGVYVEGAFYMYGGSIYKNSAPTGSGGGVLIANTGIFHKSGGTIYGSDSDPSLANTALLGAAAYYVSDSAAREATF